MYACMPWSSRQQVCLLPAAWQHGHVQQFYRHAAVAGQSQLVSIFHLSWLGETGKTSCFAHAQKLSTLPWPGTYRSQIMLLSRCKVTSGCNISPQSCCTMQRVVFPCSAPTALPAWLNSTSASCCAVRAKSGTRSLTDWALNAGARISLACACFSVSNSLTRPWPSHLSQQWNNTGRRTVADGRPCCASIHEQQHLHMHVACPLQYMIRYCYRPRH